jgi:hypothetical protein
MRHGKEAVEKRRERRLGRRRKGKLVKDSQGLKKWRQGIRRRTLKSGCVEETVTETRDVDGTSKKSVEKPVLLDRENTQVRTHTKSEVDRRLL